MVLVPTAQVLFSLCQHDEVRTTAARLLQPDVAWEELPYRPDGA